MSIRVGSVAQHGRWCFIPPFVVQFYGQHSQTPSPKEKGVCKKPTEHFLAFLDDIHWVTEPVQVATLHRELGFHLWTHARIFLHVGKTQIWNRSGQCLARTDEHIVFRRNFRNTGTPVRMISVVFSRRHWSQLLFARRATRVSTICCATALDTAL